MSVASGIATFTGTITVKTCVVDGQVEVVVADDGPGIRAENLPKIFDPFFTTKENRLGLGLAICHAAVNAPGGAFRVETQWGKGATFILAIPVFEGTQKVFQNSKMGLKANSVQNCFCFDVVTHFCNTL